MRKIRIALVICMTLSIIPWTKIFNLETRTEFTNSAIEQGGLTFTCLFIILLTYFIENVLHRKVSKLAQVLLQGIGLCALGFIIFLCFSFTNIWADKLVYKHPVNSQYIIFQHFAFGATGDRPEWRIVKANSIVSMLRRIKHIDKAAFPLLKIETWEHSPNTIPQSVTFENNTYNLLHKE
jgi:hypothetical protein